MSPAIADGDFVAVDTWAYRDQEPAINDIALVMPYDFNNQRVVKRIVATPNMTVSFSDFEVTTEFTPETITQRNHKLRTRKGATTLVVPHNHYFIVGDNRKRSEDSRSFGAVDKSLFLGRVEFSY